MNLDLPDGIHLHRVVVQHPQYGLQHPDVVPMLLDEPLQLLDAVLLLCGRKRKEGGMGDKDHQRFPTKSESEILPTSFTCDDDIKRWCPTNLT